MTASSAEIARLDLYDPAFQVSSPAVWAAREAYWYAHTNLGPAMLRYPEVAAMLKDRRLRQGSADWLAMHGITEGPVAEWWPQSIVHKEGREHARLRRLVSRAFSAPRIERIRHQTRAIAHELADRIAEQGEGDFMEDFAQPYPSRVIGQLLGIPHQDYPRFHVWATDLGLMFGLNVVADLPRVEAALLGLYDCVDQLFAQRRRNPGDDLISELIAAREAGDRLSGEELRALVVSLILAGQDTTTHQLGLALRRFIDHPDQWALLATRPDLAGTAVEEVMRVDPALPAIPRTATEDFTYQDLELPAGTFLWLFVGSANTDPAIFGDFSFDIAVARPAQLAFGGGIHHCLGAWLARVEMQEALPILATRLGDPQLAGTPTWRPPTGITGPVTLPIRFTVLP